MGGGSNVNNLDSVNSTNNVNSVNSANSVNSVNIINNANSVKIVNSVNSVQAVYNGAECKKVWSWLSAHLQPFFSAHNAYFNKF